MYMYLQACIGAADSAITESPGQRLTGGRGAARRTARRPRSAPRPLPGGAGGRRRGRRRGGERGRGGGGRRGGRGCRWHSLVVGPESRGRMLKGRPRGRVALGPSSRAGGRRGGAHSGLPRPPRTSRRRPDPPGRSGSLGAWQGARPGHRSPAGQPAGRAGSPELPPCRGREGRGRRAAGGRTKRENREAKEGGRRPRARQQRREGRDPVSLGALRPPQYPLHRGRAMRSWPGGRGAGGRAAAPCRPGRRPRRWSPPASPPGASLGVKKGNH